MTRIIQRDTGLNVVVNDSNSRSMRKFPPGLVPLFSIGAASPASQAEGSSGFVSYDFIVSRSLRTDIPASVSWVVSGIGADPATSPDFIAPISGTLSFAAGDTSKTLTIKVKSDVAIEADETFAVILSNPLPGRILVSSSSATIIDDDAAVSPPLSSDGMLVLDATIAGNMTMLILEDDFS